jgi:hypothetical protein
MKDLTWEISQNPIYNSEGVVIEGYKEIVKEEPGQPEALLSVMKNSFCPLNISEFKDIINQVSDHTDMKLENYNEFKKGKVVTAQLKSNTDFKIAGSSIEGYLTLGTGFDGNHSFFIGHVNEYLRCTNQFGRIIKTHTSKLTKNSKTRIDEVLREIIHYNIFEKELYNSFEEMQNVKIDANIVKSCVERLIGLTNEERLDNSLISPQKGQKLILLKDSIIKETNDLGENAFGLFNGVTHFTTHIMKTQEKDVFGNLFTSKGVINEKGYQFAKELLLV